MVTAKKIYATVDVESIQKERNMQVQQVSIDAIKPYKNNPRKNDAAVDAVAASISEFGVDEDFAIVNENYVVTKSGRVFTYWRNHKKWKEQKIRNHSNGYLRASIDRKDVYVHRLVAECFCENPNGYKEVNHIDGDKKNNCADNLEWCSRSQNNRHAFATGLRQYQELKDISRSKAAVEQRKKRRKISFDTAQKIRAIKGKTDREIARLYGITRGSVWQIRNGKTYAEP